MFSTWFVWVVVWGFLCEVVHVSLLGSWRRSSAVDLWSPCVAAPPFVKIRQVQEGAELCLVPADSTPRPERTFRNSPSEDNDEAKVTAHGKHTWAVRFVASLLR